MISDANLQAISTSTNDSLEGNNCMQTDRDLQ